MISVAMCTYSGARYVLEQLESIVNQTIKVDELVICDDCSHDNTIDIIESFAETAPFDVRVYQNEINLGSTKNFEKCLSLCTGDIIFLADQDDKWRADKVEKQVNFLASHPEIDAVFSNAMMMTRNSIPMGKTIWQEIEFGSFNQNKWHQGYAHEILFSGFVVTGATLAIRKSCLNRLIPFPTHLPDLLHDAWIAMVLSLENKISFIAENLIQYRIHEQQQVGFGSQAEFISLSERIIRDRREKLMPLEEKARKLNDLYLLLRSIPFVPREKLIKLYQSQKHFKTRATLPNNRLFRVTTVFDHVVRGHYKFSSKDWWLPAIGDLLE